MKAEEVKYPVSWVERLNQAAMAAIIAIAVAEWLELIV